MKSSPRLCVRTCICECVRVCHTHLSCGRDACEKRVILPDDVAGLGEAARHKEAFDDVDFLIHGLRQVGGEIAIPRRGARGDRMQKRKTEVTSQHKHSTAKARKRHTNHQQWQKKACSNSSKESCNVSNYLCKAEKLPFSSSAEKCKKSECLLLCDLTDETE